jgi:hypothetical protein
MDLLVVIKIWLRHILIIFLIILIMTIKIFSSKALSINRIIILHLLIINFLLCYTLIIYKWHSLILASFKWRYHLFVNRWVTLWFRITHHWVTYVFIILFMSWIGCIRWCLYWVFISCRSCLLLNFFYCRVSYLGSSFGSIHIWICDNTFILIVLIKNFFIFYRFLHRLYPLLENIRFLFNSFSFMIIACAHRCIFITHYQNYL